MGPRGPWAPFAWVWAREARPVGPRRSVGSSHVGVRPRNAQQGTLNKSPSHTSNAIRGGPSSTPEAQIFLKDNPDWKAQRTRGVTSPVGVSVRVHDASVARRIGWAGPFFFFWRNGALPGGRAPIAGRRVRKRNGEPGGAVGVSPNPHQTVGGVDTGPRWAALWPAEAQLEGGCAWLIFGGEHARPESGVDTARK